MIYGYARVSTKGQETNGNSLESQVAALQYNRCQEIIEESYTGTKTDRPKFSELINKLQSRDTLVVTKLVTPEK
ncbi:MAG: recombinase family protein [Clostridia bacterium]